MDVWLVGAVVGLGVVHGVLPDHGWPIAAAYALERPEKWVAGTLAALVLGVGHLISSVVLVLAYFWFAAFAAFAEGPWMKPLAGGLLIALGIYEYVSSRGDDHGHIGGETHHEHDAEGTHADHHDGEHDTERTHPDQSDDTAATDGGFRSALRGVLPGGGHAHLEHRHAEGGLRTLGATALVLGFAHEEPIQILAICAGTEFCLELMLVYSLAVIAAILAPTLLLVAGYQTHRDRIERYTPYLPAFTAAVLIAVGSGFVLGVL